MVETDEMEVASVGATLRAAREDKGLALEEVAAVTRIPTRHLQSLEQSDWASLPAPTYTMGFAKSYAAAVGLDRVEIGDQLRAEMGGVFRTAPADAEVFEAADPARTMPKWLVLAAILAVIVVVAGLTWYNKRSLQPDEEPVAAAPTEPAAPAGQAPAAAAPAQTPQGPVAITANEPVWIQVYERGGKNLFMGQLAAGQRYDVPTTSAAPLLKTGKPEALRISVGTADAPTVGPAATTVRDVSLLPADLMKGPAQPTQPAPVPAPPAAQ